MIPHDPYIKKLHNRARSKITPTNVLGEVCLETGISLQQKVQMMIMLEM